MKHRSVMSWILAQFGFKLGPHDPKLEALTTRPRTPLISERIFWIFLIISWGYSIYLKYLNTSFHYHTCSKIWASTIYYPMLCLKNCCMSGKQFRSWWDAMFCSASSGSTVCSGVSVRINMVNTVLTRITQEGNSKSTQKIWFGARVTRNFLRTPIFFYHISIYGISLIDAIPQLFTHSYRGGIHIIFFLFLDENICCGYSLEAPHRGASNEYP